MLLELYTIGDFLKNILYVTKYELSEEENSTPFIKEKVLKKKEERMDSWLPGLEIKEH